MYETKLEFLAPGGGGGRRGWWRWYTLLLFKCNRNFIFTLNFFPIMKILTLKWMINIWKLILIFKKIGKNFERDLQWKCNGCVMDYIANLLQIRNEFAIDLSQDFVIKMMWICHSSRCKFIVNLQQTCNGFATDCPILLQICW